MHKLPIALATWLALLASGVHAGDRSQVMPGGELTLTDVNLVTAIDVSGSVDRDDEKLELIGMADALLHPAVLQAIDDGHHGRIGFVAFTWSSEGDFIELVPWTAVGSRSDALRVAERLREAHKVRRYWAKAQPRRWRTFLETDISAAIERAMAALADAPFAAARSVVNICANGEDNVGIGPDGARDLAAARGIVINAVALLPQPGLADYFRAHVQTGMGSFVLEARSLGDVVGAMLRKFVTEIAWPRLRPGQVRAG